MAFGAQPCTRGVLLGPLIVSTFLVVNCSMALAAYGGSAEEAEQRHSRSFSERKTEKHIYTILDHVILIAVCLVFSAIFAGLTIGILCMDTLTLSVIASSGREPDRTHASKILPLRRQGHVTLCTLIISNMLMNVIVVQQLGTLTEMLCRFNYVSGVCTDNKGTPGIALFVVSTLLILVITEILPMSVCKSKYSLSIAAAGCSVVRVARVLVYPVAMPLGLLLDYLVPHDAGQIYDRNELRKLMILHCEAHGERSGLATSELNLLIAAMDFQEKRVSDIMKPIEEVTTVNVGDALTPRLVESLWLSGRSRIPVQERPGRYHDVLIVKDLLSMPRQISGTAPMTIGEFVNGRARTALTVQRDTPLPTVLKMLQHAETQMLFVSGTKAIDFTNDENTSANVSVALSQCTSLRDTEIIGIVTLEDVLETLIKGEIYDEYDSYDFPTLAKHGFGERSAPLDSYGIPHPLSEPVQVPRVNFYSYYVHPRGDGTLSEAQVWGVAYYLTRAVPSFYLWHPGYVKMLLDECGVQQYIFPGTCNGIAGGREDSRGMRDVSGMPHNLISCATEERAVLYRRGIESTVFTLILGGRVEVLVHSCNFLVKQRSFEWLGEGALRLPHYFPDYDAVVLHPTRLYRIPRELYDKYLGFNNVYNRVLSGGTSSGWALENDKDRATTPLVITPMGEEAISDGTVGAGGREEHQRLRGPDTPYGTFRGTRSHGVGHEEMKLLTVLK